MSTEDSQTETSIDERSRKALEEHMMIHPHHPEVRGAPDLYAVIGENENGVYVVDARMGTCDC
jgi:hypothetical protein